MLNISRNVALFFIFLSLVGTCYTKKSLAIPYNSSFVLLDYNSGTALEGYNKNLKMHPASLTKLMTLYILFDYLEEGKVNFNTKIPISKKAASMPASKLWLKAGSTILIKEAINAMIVKSANDATYAAAEFIGGTEEKFVNLMNKKALELGLKDTHFANSTGLTHNSQYSTAYDLTILARNLMLHHSKYYPLFSQKTFKWGKNLYYSTNPLLEYSNIDGLKTGYTLAAGYNLLVSCEINGIRVIVASLGNKSLEVRNNLVKQLVNSGVLIAQNFRFTKVFYKDPPHEVVVANSLLNPLSNNKSIMLASNMTNKDNEKLEINTINEIIDNSNISNVSIESNNLTSLVRETSHTQESVIYNASEEIKVTPIIHPTTKPKTKNLSFGKHFVQVGVFSNNIKAKQIAKKVSDIEPSLKLNNLKIDIIKINNKVNYRVRFNKISYDKANSACFVLKKNGIDCFTGVNN